MVMLLQALKTSSQFLRCTAPFLPSMEHIKWYKVITVSFDDNVTLSGGVGAEPTYL